MLAPLTGGGGPYGPDIVKASKLAADEINKAGGILSGRMIEIIGDRKSKSAAAADFCQHIIAITNGLLKTTRRMPRRQEGCDGCRGIAASAKR